MFRFSDRSQTNLEGVHADLVKIAETALTLSPVDFVVIEGLRSLERQRELFNKGASRTMNSRHLTGHAIDIAAWVNHTVSWDWPFYRQIATAFKEAAQFHRIALIWGGDWPGFPDGPHFELDQRVYP